MELRDEVHDLESEFADLNRAIVGPAGTRADSLDQRRTIATLHERLCRLAEECGRYNGLGEGSALAISREMKEMRQQIDWLDQNTRSTAAHEVNHNLALAASRGWTACELLGRIADDAD